MSPLAGSLSPPRRSGPLGISRRVSSLHVIASLLLHGESLPRRIILFLIGRTRPGFRGESLTCRSGSSLARYPRLHNQSLPRWIIATTSQEESSRCFLASLILGGLGLVSSALLVCTENLLIAGSLSLPRSSESSDFVRRVSSLKVGA